MAKKKVKKKAVKRKVAKRKVKKKVTKKTKTKRKAPKKPFGGMTICPDKNLALILGKACVTPSQMTKKLWAYVKKKKLLKKGK
ncbi:hypothetical protein ACFLZB_04525 [Nanoarchaeota archaeon]